MSEVVRAAINPYTRRHLRIGWWSVLGFLSVGLGLEWLHAEKIPWYLNEAYTTRRLMWTLGHAHGVLLGLLHLAFAATLSLAPAGAEAASRRIASACLTSAGILLPAGFLLGGVVVYGGDPGPGVFLVPIGGGFLVVAVFLTARLVSSRG